MRATLIVLALASFVSAPAFAKAPKKPRVPSAVERQGKAYTVDAQPLTLSVGAVGAATVTGGSVGAYLGPHLIARATYRAGESCLEERCAYVERAASVTLQQFVSNSFFVEVGLMTQRNTYHPVYDYYSSTSERDATFTYDAETRGATVSIGNQWQWKSFTLGARWGQYYRPLQSVSSKLEEDGNAAGSEEKMIREKMQAEQKLYLPSLLIGTSF